MESITEKKLSVVLVLKKPHGEIKKIASYGLMQWGEDEFGKKFIRWHDSEWLPAVLEYEQKDEKEGKKEEKKEEKE